MSELSEVMAAVNDLNESHGVTQRGGKKYTEVAKRVEAFRKHFGFKYGITTDIIIDDGKRVVIKSKIFDLVNSTIPVGEGYAEEIRGSSNVNKTSAIENCETSAIGRALASCGLHGGQYASMDEIIKADRNDKAIDNNALNEKPKQESKVDWTLYIAKQQESITRMKTLTALSSWTNNEAKNLEHLAAADKPKWTAIFNFWSARNEEIKNG
tara:strand:- start:1602 stop:2234 length:633 start_codon:yes stop_codon:yes gene_type:complete